MMPAKPKSEYARSGVDYTVMEPFKMAMIEAGKRTLAFPEKRGVFINSDVVHSHGAVYEYRGNLPHMWCNTEEGLGNKNWIAEWMYQHAPAGAADRRGSDADNRGKEDTSHGANADVRGTDPSTSLGVSADKRGRMLGAESAFSRGAHGTYYEGIGIDTALMMVNDVIAQGAMPIVFTDGLAVGDPNWYADEKRAKDLAEGFYKVCKEVGMALPAGESASVKYLLKPEPPVTAAPSLSGCVTGIIVPKDRLVTGAKLAVGDCIVGAASSGLHANGVSLVIRRAMGLLDQFLTKIPNGRTLGEEALIPTRSYVALIEALLEAEVDIHALLPSTGDGVGKLAFDHRPFNYRVKNWVPVPPLFQFFRELGVTLEDCLKTFNWGIGYYIFIPPSEVERTLQLGRAAGYEMAELGVVEAGERNVIFEPEGITLHPPGE